MTVACMFYIALFVSLHLFVRDYAGLEFLNQYNSSGLMIVAVAASVCQLLIDITRQICDG